MSGTINAPSIYSQTCYIRQTTTSEQGWTHTLMHYTQTISYFIMFFKEINWLKHWVAILSSKSSYLYRQSSSRHRDTCTSSPPTDSMVRLSRFELGHLMAKSWWSKTQNSNSNDVLRTKDTLRIATLLRCDVIGTMTKTTAQVAAKPPFNEPSKPCLISIRWWKPWEKS